MTVILNAVPNKFRSVVPSAAMLECESDRFAATEIWLREYF